MDGVRGRNLRSRSFDSLRSLRMTAFCGRVEVRQDGAQVEQCLGGMLVHAVACVEDRQAGLGLQQPGSAGGVVAQDDRFGAEGAQRQAGIFQRLALLDARREAGNQRGIRAEALGGQLKAGAGARGGLVEEQRHAALGQDAIPGKRVLVFESCGTGENKAYSVQTQVSDREQRSGMVGERRGGNWRRMKLAAYGGCGWVHTEFTPEHRAPVRFRVVAWGLSAPMRGEPAAIERASPPARPAAPARRRLPRGTSLQ